MVSSKGIVANSSTLTGWYKSSHSGGDQGECLEVARGHAHVPVRDSKRPTGPALTFPPASWSAFVTAVSRGEFSA
ncbi:DUF397 domain-containing protein [Streptomyces sp. NPDC001793]|uniref:DUF397 domain-containing protein n=1 Tax=unclassified Streptomyces TaxID=2593676 RepID=UPI00332A8AEC